MTNTAAAPAMTSERAFGPGAAGTATERRPGPAVRAAAGLFRCPSCGGDLAAKEATPDLVCRGCGERARVLADSLVDFLGKGSAAADAILAWPIDGMAAMEETLVALRRGDRPDAAALAPLRRLGLVEHGGTLTPLGAMAAYNSSEYVWQGAYDPLEGLAEPPRLSASSRVLDVGSGSGQTLRRLFPRLEGWVIGLDNALDILAYGSKLFEAYDLPALFCCASAHDLPFQDDCFDFIICRGVISYTLQRRALAELFRVLRPGALIFFRNESFVWDLRALTHPTGVLRYAFDLRSFAVGLMHAWTGWQPMPGGAIRGPRAYVARRRFRRTVETVGGEVVRWESSRRGPQFLGRGTQDVVLCRKLASS